jgi:ZIP family zinc transporter
LLSFTDLNPVFQALVATLFTWFITAVGAASIFLTKTVNRKVLDSLMGFAAGVMIAASFWSLLAPSIELGAGLGLEPFWLPAAAGFLLGSLFVLLLDKTLPHLHPELSREYAEGPKTGWQRTILMVSAITIHNIPEGLAVGVAFGAAAAGISGTSLGAAVALAIGIGLQNFPEGLAVAAPLRSEGMSRLKSFWYGQLSAAVEPVAGVLGAAFVFAAQPLLPYALSFAAGAMIFVAVEEVIPASHRSGNTDLATVSLVLGFLLMMVLDVVLG